MDYIILELVTLGIALVMSLVLLGIRKAVVIVAGYLVAKTQVKRSKLKQFRKEVGVSTLIWCELAFIGALLIDTAMHDFTVFELSGVVKVLCLVFGLVAMFVTFIKINIDILEMVETCLTIEDDLGVDTENFRECNNTMSRLDRQAIMDFINLKAFAKRISKYTM